MGVRVAGTSSLNMYTNKNDEESESEENYKTTSFDGDSGDSTLGCSPSDLE